MNPSEGSPQSEQLFVPTKFSPPAVPRRAVERPQLMKRLDAAIHRPLTLVAAGAGFGKTTLAAQWVDRASARSSWLSLDRLDGDPERFARYFVEALEPLLPRPLTHTQALLRARTAPPWPYFVEVLMSELAGPQELSVLVLDDCHTVASEQMGTILERVVETLPPTVRLMVLTRVDPPWPLGRWRAHGMLNELRSGDLRFSLDEAREFFDRRSDLPLDDETVEIVHRKTEGWIAGLRLAELSMAGIERPKERARTLTGTDRNVADFLVEEVLGGQPQAVREFLAVTAQFDKFCAELCDHVLTDDDRPASARKIIESLDAQNMFLVPLDQERRWYRFHHLFREFLLQRTDSLTAPSALTRAHSRGAEWFSGQGMVEDAIRHWVAAGELDAAAQLVGRHADLAARADLSRQVISLWLSFFPTDAEHDRLELLVARGFQKLIQWDLSGLAQLLERADSLSTAADSAILANLEAIRSFFLYWTGDSDGALASALRSLSLGPRIGGMSWTLARVYAAGASARLGRTPEGLGMLDEGMATAARAGESAPEFIAVQGILHLYAQEFDAVRRSGLQLMAAHEREPVPEYWMGYGYYLLGCEAYERNRLDESRDWFDRVRDLRYLVISRIFHDALVGLALVARARGDSTAMERYAAEARDWALEIGDPSSLRVAQSLEQRLNLASRDQIVSDTGPPAEEDYHSFWLEVPSITRAAQLLRDKRPDAPARALHFIEAAIARMQEHHNPRQTTILEVMRALALDAGGQHDAALEALTDTLHAAAPFGLIRTFLDRGPRLEALVDELSQQQGPDAYIELLRGQFLDAHRPAHRSGNLDGDGGDLTFRELEVLELLAERMTDKEIAARLSVTAGAIKKRTHSIYRKLEVGDRREAVARALARGILRTGN